MSEIWFCYTMLFILMCLFSASQALSAYFVSRRGFYLGVMAFFLAFCLDTSLIFLDEYSYLKPATAEGVLTFPFLHPWIKLAFSLLFIGSVWWLVLEIVERRTWRRIIVPCAVCGVVQAAAVLFVPDTRLSQWLFYSVRDLCVLASLGYALWAYRRHADDALRRHLGRYRRAYLAFVVLVVLVFAEDSLMMYWLAPLIPNETFLYHLSERNICENVAVIFCAVLAIRSTAGALAVRFHEPPTATSTNVERRAHTQLARYADRCGLTPRERDVLALMLEGKDNQNIASALTLSLGTVKAHVHNIYRKADVSSRQQLLQSFWKED
ncbi:helix-turn-helix transcriptional regulator [Arabiibacter massiliensis]|uniref:helix-turn-helix transcriptional regulator n=1 Tax=Arabiibacter massiliensis TaxID=1870985 RepID=UPI0009BB1F6B|nr:LuxR family transcriptional regulator [Arabiibacter massiliensis]